MKLLTYYTNSHKKIYELFFLPSYNEFLNEDFKLVNSEYDQITEDISYGTNGFNQTMIGKIEHILKNIDTDDKEPLVFSDCDVQFFQNISNDLKKEIEDYDIKFQDDIVCVCAGFFICKQNENVKFFFENVLNNLKNSFINGYDDQQIINSFLRSGKYNLKHGLLPKNKYFTVASSNNSKQWTGESFIIPKNILVHHANWTVGIENKLKLLEYVKSNR